jgi:hypothetical protein
MEYLVDEQVEHIPENNKIDSFTKEFVNKYGENYKVILRRLKKELKLLDTMNIDYKLSVNPLRKKSLNYNNLVQIEFAYLNYNLYIFIPEHYPFEQPLLMMDKLSIDERKYRVQDGLEDTKISFLHNYISNFVVDTKADDLICIKEFVENNFVVPKDIQPNDIDPRRVYYMKFSKYFSPTVFLKDVYKVMVEGIHLALGIDN